ncbi:MAG: MFS transporter [Silicimonas sp.]|nr:MFS transporter [Silicimonas sp.]
METRQQTDWVLVILLWIAGLGAAAQYGKVSVVYDRLGAHYPEAGTTLGFAVSLVGFTGMVLGVFAGLVVARLRYRRTLLWALGFGTMISLYQSTLPPLPLLLASRIVEGISHLAIVVSAPTLIAELSAKRHAGFTLTLWGTFFGVSFAILVFGGLPLADAFGVGGLFAAHGIFMGLIALPLALRLPRIAKDRPEGVLSIRHILQRHVAIYRSPWISAAGVGWLFYTLCFVSLLTLLPQFIAAEVRALVIGAMPLVSIISSLTLGVFLLRILPAVRVIQLGFSASAALALSLMAAPGHPALCIALAAALGLVQGASFAAVPQLNEAAADRAAAYGSMAQTGNIGNTIGTPLLAAVIAVSGNAAMMLTAGSLLFLGLVVHLWLERRRQRTI